MADNSWLTASPVSGSGDLSVSVGGSLWTGRLDRSGQLTVSGVTFPALSCVLNCTQAGSVILESIGESSATVGALVEGYVALQGVSIRSNLASLTFSFVGSDGDSAWVSGIRYSVDGGDTMLDSGESIPGDPGATGAYTAAVYVSVAEETSGVSRSGVLTVSGSGQTLEFTISQSAGVKTYGPVEILSLTAADVPASGGSVTSGSVSYRQTYGWNGATSGAGTITSGGSVSWSGGASGIGSLGTTVKDRSVVGSPLVVTVALNDQVGSSSVAIYQAANVSTLTGISADTLSYDAIPVLGGSSSPYYSISGSYSYTSGSTSTSVIDSVVRSRMRAATAATKSFAFVAPVAGFTIDSGTGVVSATETEQSSEKVAQVKMSVEYEGFSSSVTGTCLQPAGSVVYGTPTVALSYATAPAAGGTLRPVFSVTQPWGWNNDTDAGVLSYDLESLPDGSSVNFTTTAGTVGSKDGSITVPTKGTTESGVTTYATITCAVTVNGVSGSGTAAVSQAANTKALTDVSIERNGSGALVTSFTAAGGTAYYKPVGVYTYTSTSTQTVELDSEVTEDNWSLDQAWGSVAANPTYPWCSVVTINSRGTAIGNSRSAVLKLTVGGLSDSVTLTQAGNYVTNLSVVAATISYPTISAGATSATPSVVGSTYPWTYTFSSGSKWNTYDTPSSTYGTLSQSSTWTLSTVQNGFTKVNSQTGVLTATNRGTEIGNARTSGVVTRKYTCSWIPTSAYNAEGTKTATDSKTTTCTQEGNYIESLKIGGNSTTSYIAASGAFGAGENSHFYTGWGVLSSGSQLAASYNGAGTWSISQNYFNKVYPDSSGVLKVTAESRGTVVGNKRSATLKWDLQTDNTNNKPLSVSVVLTQAENKVESYGTPTGRTLSVSDVPASGGTVSSGTLGGTITQTRTFSSRASDTITNPTVTSSSYSAGVSNGSLGNTVVPRTKIGTLTYSYVCNGQKGSVSADVYQAVNQVESIKIGGNSGDSTIFTTPKVDVACGENEWWQYSCWATYSSNATKSILASDFTLTSNQSWATVSTGNANWLKRVDFASRGTTPGEVRSVTLTANYSGKSATVSVAQEANNLERVAITTGGGVDDPLQTLFSAAGFAFVAAAWSYYTSNAKQEIQDATFDNWAISGSGFLMTADPNFGFAVDIGVENRGTTVGPERSATLSFEYSGKSDSITLTQEANTQTQTSVSIEIDHDFQDPLGYNNTNVPAAGGRVCIIGIRHYSYTSGSTSQSEYDSFTLSSNQSWCVPDDGSNLTISSRGTVTGSDRSATVYWHDGSFKSNEMTITQKTNTLTWNTPTISRTTPVSMPVGGGTNNVATGLTYSQTGQYSSGSPASASSGGSLSYSVVTAKTGFSLSGSTVTVTNNTSTSARNGFVVRITLKLNGKTATKDITYNQIAGYYTYATPVVSASYSTIPASGGTVTPTVSYSQTYGWNGATSGAGTKTSGGSVSYSGTSVNTSNGSVTAGSKGTTVSGVTTVTNATVTVDMNGKRGTKTIAVQQAANAVIDSNHNPRITTYGTPTVSIGSGMTAAGGSATVSHSVTNTQTYNAFYTSGATGPDQTRSVAGTTTISITSNGNNAFSLSGNTLSHRDMATTLATDSVTITAKNSGDTSKTKTVSTSITNSRQATGSSGGVTTYGNVVAGTITNKTIPASGGSATATAGNGSQSWSKTAVVTTYNYTSGDTKQETTTAASSGNNTIAPSVSSITANASSKGQTVSGQTTVKTQAVTWSGSGNKSASGTMYIYQAANSLKSYSNVLINQFNYNNIPYSGGSSSPVMDITYDVTYDSGTYSDEHGLPTGYSLTYGTTGSWFNLNTSSGVITAPSNSTPDIKSTVVTVKLSRNSDHVVITSAQTTVKQAAKPGPVDIYITTSFDYASSQIQINFSTGPKDTFFIKFVGYDQFGGIWEYVTGISPSPNTTVLFSPPGYNITDQFSIEGLGDTEYTISPTSPYETNNARYYW